MRAYLESFSQSQNVGRGSSRRIGPLPDVTVLWPDVRHALAGVGSSTPDGGTLHPHAVAVVVRIAYSGGRSVLLGSDLERAGFEALINDGLTDFTSDVLIYPHHGGKSAAGTEAAEERFAEELTRAVNPEVVLFSNGRGRFGTPRREIVRGVRAARQSPTVRLVCTQLSEHCSATVIPNDGRLDTRFRSAGGAAGASCSGSVRIDLVGGGPVLPGGRKHMNFVVNGVGAEAMCYPEQGADTQDADIVATAA